MNPINLEKLETLRQQALTHALLEPQRQLRRAYLRRAFKAAKYALRTTWAAFNLEPKHTGA